METPEGNTFGIICIEHFVAINYNMDTSRILQDSIALYDHTLKVTDYNWLVYYNRAIPMPTSAITIKQLGL